jgi:hypothetical protein
MSNANYLIVFLYFEMFPTYVNICLPYVFQTYSGMVCRGQIIFTPALILQIG